MSSLLVVVCAMLLASSCKGEIETNACLDQVSLVCDACGTSSYACQREEDTKRLYYDTRATPEECKSILSRTKATLAMEGNELFCLSRKMQKFMNNAPGSAEQLEKLQQREAELRQAR